MELQGLAGSSQPDYPPPCLGSPLLTREHWTKTTEFGKEPRCQVSPEVQGTEGALFIHVCNCLSANQLVLPHFLSEYITFLLFLLFKLLILNRKKLH